MDHICNTDIQCNSWKHFLNKISLKKGSDLTNISKINKHCLKRTIKNWYLTNWRYEIKESIKSKLYSSYKSKIEISPYLVNIHNRRYRNALQSSD